jgi:hypothetical protein
MPVFLDAGPSAFAFSDGAVLGRSGGQLRDGARMHRQDQSHGVELPNGNVVYGRYAIAV